MNKKKVDIRHLLKVRKRYEYEPEFNLFAIVKEVKQLYEAVCTIGLEKVDVCYEENGKMEVENDKIKVTKKGKIKTTKIGYFFDCQKIV